MNNMLRVKWSREEIELLKRFFSRRSNFVCRQDASKKGIFVEGPVEISFKNVEKTTQLENLINKKIAKLEKICSHMISCRVMVERLQKSQATGNPYCVRIDMTVPPTHELIAKQTASKSNMHRVQWKKWRERKKIT